MTAGAWPGGAGQAGQSAEDAELAPPALSLPKGGGAISGMGEKFTANPVTGTGAMTFPIYASRGRAGFTPQLSIGYDSGHENGPFGFGWKLRLPSISRKTSLGLPCYDDARDSDVFLLSGAEDLMPVLVPGDGSAAIVSACPVMSALSLRLTVVTVVPAVGSAKNSTAFSGPEPTIPWAQYG